MTDHIYCVYKHTSPSGKSYIGITLDYTARCKSHQRADGSCPGFHNAIRKYGWDAFTHEILLEGMTIDEAKEMEILLIEKFDTRRKGYNYHPGGGGHDGTSLADGFKTDKHIAKIAASCATREHPVELKIKAYMARWKKTRAEAEEYYRKKAEDPATVMKYHGKPYVGYAAKKKFLYDKRAERMGNQLEPNSAVPTPDVGNTAIKSVPAFEWVSY